MKTKTESTGQVISNTLQDLQDSIIMYSSASSHSGPVPDWQVTVVIDEPTDR